MPLLARKKPLINALAAHLRADIKISSTALCLATLLPLAAYAQPQAIEINIPAQPLDSALREFGRQTNLQMIYRPENVQGVSSSGIKGRISPTAALDELLKETSLSYEINGTTVTLSSSTMLKKISVHSTGIDATTEGTGSYIPTGPIGTATPLGLSIKETPQSVSVVTNQRMKDQGLVTIRDVLEQTPGITLVTTGTERIQATSRGYQITNYQLDGLNTHSDYGGAAGPASQSLANMAMYDRIELIRGASGLMSGAGDPSGAINMVRKKPTIEPQIQLEGAVGSWREKRAIIDASSPINTARTVRGRLVLSAEGTESFIDNYDHDEQLVYGVIEIDLSATTFLTIGADHQRTKSNGSSNYGSFPLWFSNGEQTDFPVSISLASRDNELKTRSSTIFSTLEQQLAGDWKLKISGNYGKSSQDEELVYLDTNGRFADSLTGDGLILDAAGREYETQFESYDLNIRGPFKLFNRQHEVVFGLAYEDYKKIADGYFDSSGLDARPANIFTWDRAGAAAFSLKSIDWDAYREQYSTYAAGRIELSDQLKFILGVRSISYKDSLYTANVSGYLYKPHSSEHGVLTPYAGVIFDIDEIHTAYASYSTIYQPQYYRDRDGDLIDPREGASYEIGVKSSWLSDALNTAAAIYQMDQDNLTETDPDYILVPGTTSEFASRVIPGARTRGVDLEISGALASNWKISASWTYSLTENSDEDRVKTTFPRHIAKLWTIYQLPNEWNRLTLGGGVNWQSKIYNTVYSWGLSRDLHWEQNSYAVTNLMAKYDFSNELSASLNANNIFDKKYIVSANDWWFAGGGYGAPRNYSLSIDYKFK